MSARASVFNATQLGVETTKGTRVQTVRRLLSTGFMIKPSIPIKPFTPQGTKYATESVGGKEHTVGDANGTAAFNDMCYLLSTLLTTAVISTPSGATATRQWVFSPVSRGPDNPVTYTVEMGSSVEAERAVEVLLDGLTLKVMKEEASTAGTILGKITSENIAMSTGRDSVYTVNLGGATGGTFTLTVAPNTTSALANNATATAVQAALTGLGSVGANNATVTGPAGGPFVITFVGTKGSQQVVLTANFGSLTGAGATSITETVTGQALADVKATPMDPEIFSVFSGTSMANDVQTLTIDAGVSAGNYKLTFSDPYGVSHTTSNILFSANAAAIQSALTAEGMGLNVGDVTVTGTGPFTITFGGRFANLFIPLLGFDDSGLTGTNLPFLAIAHTTQGGLILLQKCLEFEWALTGRYLPEFTIKADDLSWTDFVETAPKHELTLVVEHDSVAAGYMSEMRAKTARYIRLANIGAEIEHVSTNHFNYWFRMTWAFDFQANDRADNSGVYASTFKMTPVIDANIPKDTNGNSAILEALIWTDLTGLES